MPDFSIPQYGLNFVGIVGFEPTAFRLSGGCSTRPSYTPGGNLWVFCLHSKSLWWGVRASNPRPPICKNGALPTELTPRESVGCCPAALRRTHDDVESGSGVEPEISWVATRRHTNLTTRSKTA